MNIEENNNLSTLNNNKKEQEISNQIFIENKNLSEQMIVLENFFNVYSIKKENESVDNNNLEIFKDKKDLFKYFKEIDNNFKKFFSDQNFINTLNKNNLKRIREIKNKLIFMISNASRNLSNFFKMQNDLYNFEFKNKKSDSNKLKEDFFGKFKSDEIYEDLVTNKNKKFLREFNKSFPLSKVEITLNIKLNKKELLLSNDNLDKYYQYIFKNIYWLRTFLQHREDIDNTTKNRLNIPIAILSLLLINDFYAKVNFNDIKAKYIHILNKYIYKIKDEKNKNDKFNIIIKIERFFFRQLNILLNKENLKLPYNNFEYLDDCIKKSEEFFNISQYSNLLKNINKIENYLNEDNFEEKSFLYKKRDFYRQKYLSFFNEWHLFIYNLQDFLSNQFNLLKKNEIKIFEILENIKKKYQNLDQKIINETKNNNFEKIKELEKEQKKYQLTYQIYIKYLDLKEKIKNPILNNKKNLDYLKETKIELFDSFKAKIFDEKNKIYINLYGDNIFNIIKINEKFEELKVIFNGYRHNKKDLFYITDKINEDQKNLKELINYLWKIINNLITRFKNLKIEDWFYFEKNSNLLKTENKLKEDHRSNVLLQLNRLITNFKVNILNLNAQENYFEKIEEKIKKKIKIFYKKNLNQRNDEFYKFKKEILKKYNFYPNSKLNIEKFYKQIEDIRRNKNAALQLIKGNKDYFEKIYNLKIEIDNSFQIKFVETKKIDFEYKNKKELLNAIKYKKELNRKKLLLYYQSILNYNKVAFKINSLDDINEEILKELIKKNAFISSKKYYVYNEENFKNLNQDSKQIELFFNNDIYPKLKNINKIENYLNEDNFEEKKYLDYKLKLEKKYLDYKLKLEEENDINLKFYKEYQNIKNFKKDDEILKLYLNFIFNKKTKLFPTKTLFFYIKKNIINLTSSKDFKDSFYSGKNRNKNNFNLRLFKNNFDFLADEIDFNNNKFSENFKFVNMKKYIEQEIKKQNKNIQSEYFKNLILDPIETFKLKYKRKSDWLDLGDNFKSYQQNKKLYLNKIEFYKIYDFFLKNIIYQNDYHLIFNELKKHKNNFKNNFSRKKFPNIDIKENNFKFIADCEIKRFSFKKTDKISNYLIRNIEIINKINNKIFIN